MIVWTRTPVPATSDAGDMTPEGRAQVAHFIREHFMARLPEDCQSNLLWFRNWGNLRSVSSIDHVHVIVRHVESRLIEQWTMEPEM